MQLSSGSTTSLPMLKKLHIPPPSTKHPLEKKKTKGRVRRPSSAGAPPPLHMIEQAGKTAAGGGGEKAEPGTSGWDYCSLPVATEMAEGLAGEWCMHCSSCCVFHELHSAGKWSEIERCYVSALKAAFRRLRRERETICRYIHRRK